MKHRAAWFAVVCCLLGSNARLAAEEPAFSPESLEFFERQVRPVLAQHCWECHGEKKQEAGLRLDSRRQPCEGATPAWC